MIVAIAQINTHAGDFGATVERMKTITEDAANKGAQLVVFPAPTLTGQAAMDYPNREGFQMDLLQALEELSQGISCPALVSFFAEQEGESYREAILLRDGTATPLHMEAYAAEERYVRETHGMQKDGTPPEVPFFIASFEMDGMKFAVAQSYDDLDDLLDASEHFDVVLYIPGYGYALDDAASVLGAALGENRFKADAVSLEAWLVAVGAVGGYGLQTYTGSSFVMSDLGELVASVPAFEESLLVADIAPTRDEGETPKGAERTEHPLNVLEPELYNRSLHLWQALTLGLRDYFHKQSQQRAVMLMDGSIGSCLLTVLASDALGPTNVHVMMAAFANDRMMHAAHAVAGSLHVNVAPCPLDLAALPEKATLRADLYRACLADVARSVDGIPLSSEDKTHLALEVTPSAFCVSELLPFGDVYRSDLIELGHMRNTISPIIPSDAFDAYAVPAIDGLEEAEPTPEMRLKRLDVTLATHIEWERPLSSVVARHGEPAVTAEIIRRFRERAAARESWPVSLMASTRPLSHVHTPLCLSWQDQPRSEEDRVRATKLAQRFLRPTQTHEPSDTAPPNLSGLLKGLEMEIPQGMIPREIDRGMIEGALGEILGLLQDISGGEQPSLEGPFGPLTWGSPFSEN